MSRKIPNQKKKYKELEKRINTYTLELERIFETLNTEAARLALTTSYDNTGEELFSFKDFPETKYGIELLQEQYVNDIRSLIYSSTSQEWHNSNLATDLMADGVLKSYTGFVNRELHTQYYQANSDVLKAFQQRKDRGLSLSSKLWKQSQDYRNSLESVISLALERGTSAVTLSKQISKYLKDYSTLQKDYKEKYGKAAKIYDCEYRSARLARSEINIAYRTAEQTRWGQMDFVIGYEVKLSNNHNCKGVPKGEFVDICDYLAGKYPKDFKFVGWHPQCRCYTIPILKTDEEYLYDLPGKNEVKDVPDGFKQWIGTNSYRIEKAEKRGTLPYYIRDNKAVVDNILNYAPTYTYYWPKGFDSKQKGLWIENIVSIESKVGIHQSKPMNFKQANEGHANPLYNKSIDYQNNCQKCVIANELRRRGFNVEAFDGLGSYVNEPYEIWRNISTGDFPKVVKITNENYTNLGKMFNEAVKEKGRYHMKVQWDEVSSHIITVEKTRNEVRIYDPQSGKTKELAFYFENKMKNSPLIIYRVDDCLINTENIEKIVKKV